MHFDKYTMLIKLYIPIFSSFQKAMHLGSNHHLYDDKNKLNKAFLKEVLGQHFKQADLKVFINK